MKKNETLLTAGIALVVGLLLGIIISNVGIFGKQERRAAPPPGAPPTAPTVNYQQQIEVLEGILKEDPANRNAWVQLGHHYFDSDQPVKAVEAYNKALELDPNDPDVLTDQGVMFRRLGWYDKAIENFRKANELDPSHQQSLFNLGIVYRHDLKDFAKAKEAWEKFLALNPGGPAAEQVRAELEFIQTHPPIPKSE